MMRTVLARMASLGCGGPLQKYNSARVAGKVYLILAGLMYPQCSAALN